MDLIRRYVEVEVPITVGTDPYTAGDVVGGTLVSDAIPQFAGGVVLDRVRLVDATGQAEPFTLHLYNATPSAIADGDPFAPTAADWLKWQGAIDIPAASYDTTGDASGVMVAAVDRKTGREIAIPALPTGQLAARLVAGDTPDYTDPNDLTLHLGMWVL